MKRAAAPGYDLFKLIVTLILLAILAFLLLRSCSSTQPPIAISDSTRIIITETASPSPIQTTMTVAPTTTSAIATCTSSPSLTAVPAISPTPVSPAVTVIPTASQPSALACAITMPSRLSIGISAQIIADLNMRNAPDISAQILQTNPSGTQVEIIDGPVCTPKGQSAYLWWKIRLDTGLEGWSAETPLNNRYYFLEPIR